MHFSKTVIIQNKAGIHCRPSAEIIKVANSLKPTTFRIKTSQQTIDLNSLLALISCGIKCGESITITASGDDAQEACERLADLFAYNFDFPSQA